MKEHSDSKPPRRGRPRSEEARGAILQTAYAMLASHGPGRLTIEAVAAQAGVGKPTIYRYWPNARALEMAAMLEQPAPDTSVCIGSSAISDLHQQLTKVVAIFAERRGRQMAQMLAAAEPDSELAKVFRNQVILKCREEGRTILVRAIDEGDIRSDLKIEIALDMIYGPLFYRLLVGHAPLDEAFAYDLITVALAGLTSTDSGLKPVKDDVGLIK
jgi:AcrR family transcriptional regulator